MPQSRFPVLFRSQALPLLSFHTLQPFHWPTLREKDSTGGYSHPAALWSVPTNGDLISHSLGGPKSVMGNINIPTRDPCNNNFYQPHPKGGYYRWKIDSQGGL